MCYQLKYNLFLKLVTKQHLQCIFKRYTNNTNNNNICNNNNKYKSDHDRW